MNAFTKFWKTKTNKGKAEFEIRELYGKLPNIPEWPSNRPSEGGVQGDYDYADKTR